MADATLSTFLSSLDQYNPQLLDAGYTGLSDQSLQQTNLTNEQIAAQLAGLTPSGLNQAQAQTANIAQALQGIGAGAADPRFEAYRQAQLNLLGNQRSGALAKTSENLSRSGFGGGSSELNAGAAINNQYNQQEQSLSSQLGGQSLNRQDAALQNAMGAYGQSANLGLAGTQAQSALLGQQAGLNQQNLANILAQIQSANQAKGGNLEALTAGLQNLAAPYALETARTAANQLAEETTKKRFGITGMLDNAFGSEGGDAFQFLDAPSASIDWALGNSGK